MTLNIIDSTFQVIMTQLFLSVNFMLGGNSARVFVVFTDETLSGGPMLLNPMAIFSKNNNSEKRFSDAQYNGILIVIYFYVVFYRNVYLS